MDSRCKSGPQCIWSKLTAVLAMAKAVKFCLSISACATADLPSRSADEGRSVSGAPPIVIKVLISLEL